MIGRALAFSAAVALMALLAACSEKPQTLGESAHKVDTEPWIVSASANPAFVAPGWRVGDRDSWEEWIRQRNQSQNDYAR